jgi:hypothetical protein
MRSLELPSKRGLEEIVRGLMVQRRNMDCPCSLVLVTAP